MQTVAPIKNKIVPHLWFDQEAEEAAVFYTSMLPDSAIKQVTTLSGVPTPGGNAITVAFALAGHEFMAINAGPHFKINPSISFFLNFDPAHDKRADEHIAIVWEQLAADGIVLMPFDRYPFAARFGWVQDRYGVSWQLILADPAGEPRPFIVPALLFVGEVAGRAEEAIDFYTSVFGDAKRGNTSRYPAGSEPDREGTLMFADFMLEGQWFAAQDSAYPHDFAFNEAISFLVNCDTQAEIDYYWERLSAVPEAEQCGWLKDKFGVSWQIVPRIMNTMMASGDSAQLVRLTQAFLTMKKFDIETLLRAFAR